MITYQTESNSIHYTLERLKCGFCNKYVKEVIEIKPQQYFCFISGGCYYKRFPSFFSNGVESIKVRLIVDVDFDIRKEVHKKRRQEVTPKVRYRILKRDGFKCVLCGKTARDTKLEIDHIHPISLGGDSSDKNLRTLCADCNGGKSNEMV